MAYTNVNDPSVYFQTTLYTGNGGTQSVTNGGNSDLQPDLVWIKDRDSGAAYHRLVDTVRGATKLLYSNGTNAQDTDATSLTSFNSDGFTVSSGGGVNASGNSFVSWNWKAGTSFTNDASSTGIGTIDSAGSFNNTAGFSIVSYTGTGSNGTIKHGLSTAPEMYITKSLSSARSWAVYNQNIGNTKAVFLNSTDAQDTDATYWNSTSPTSSVLSLGTRSEMNHSGENFIAYCFAPKQGYSKFGSYAGNGNADGPFTYTGFKPAFVMIKNTSSGSTKWTMCDNKRDGFNDNNHRLFANTDDAESTSNPWEMYSNGFKMTTTGSFVNASGSNYIYMAFAENPLVGSNFVPTTAR
tara:strand:+ start:35 stop:1090 length:1056 start_codon:yes stop_codon:yes gene_type:complete